MGTGSIGRTVEAVAAPRRPIRWFARWVADSCGPGADVLEIGAGCHRSGDLQPIRRRRPHLVGVDPSETIWQNAELDERFQETVEDFARDHAADFDVAFAVFVLEHVADPAAFSDACARVLRPGGVLLGLTVNKYQYFGFATWMTSRLGVTDRVLARIDHGHGHAHHVPTVYRMNSPGQVSRHLGRAGFESVAFRMFDKPEMYEWYLPPPLRPMACAWSAAAYRMGSPRLMGHLAFRASLGDGPR
jgi:SAM-dependent methyltransferase